ncbi:MAG: RHS repeat-associated core domain-containing protein [Bacteroidales bacterium]|nr:RHS repeat-associated core domain-containing protein [Bacteroidales bacterium]
MNRRRPYCQMNPLTGIWPACATDPGYRYASPDGDGFPVTYSVTHSHTDHSSLITVHSSYTFSAKEKDSETGLSYFGARYYSSELSIWLSVDPMASKYPSLSPYVYCADNPVKLVDPNGDSIINGYSNALISATEKMQQAKVFFNSLSKRDKLYFLAKQDYKEKYTQYYLIKKKYDCVQKIITDFKNHSPEMYNKLNHLHSPSGIVDVYVFVNYYLNSGIYTGQSEIQHFFSHHPSMLLGGIHFFPLIDYKNEIFSMNGVKLIINPRYSDQVGKSFAHEGGHIFYEVTFPVEYAIWLMKNGNQSARTGHLKDENNVELNPSGQEAHDWERSY